MSCLDCGNCKQGDTIYYCPDKNDFVVKDEKTAIEKQKAYQGWKKGSPDYEKHRRQIRQNDSEKIG